MFLSFENTLLSYINMGREVLRILPQNIALNLLQQERTQGCLSKGVRKLNILLSLWFLLYFWRLVDEDATDFILWALYVFHPGAVATSLLFNTLSSSPAAGLYVGRDWYGKDIFYTLDWMMPMQWQLNTYENQTQKIRIYWKFYQCRYAREIPN